jgi:hypothetical protein
VEHQDQAGVPMDHHSSGSAGTSGSAGSWFEGISIIIRSSGSQVEVNIWIVEVQVHLTAEVQDHQEVQVHLTA